MILNAGLSDHEQTVFPTLLAFFDGEESAEREALVLTRTFAQ